MQVPFKSRRIGFSRWGWSGRPKLPGCRRLQPRPLAPDGTAAQLTLTFLWACGCYELFCFNFSDSFYQVSTCQILWPLSYSAWTLGSESLPPFRLLLGGESDWLGFLGLWSSRFPALAWNLFAFAPLCPQAWLTESTPSFPLSSCTGGSRRSRREEGHLRARQLLHEDSKPLGFLSTLKPTALTLPHKQAPSSIT